MCSVLGNQLNAEFSSHFTSPLQTFRNSVSFLVYRPLYLANQTVSCAFSLLSFGSHPLGMILVLVAHSNST
ncbi:hypothetical protein B0H12DRAFT_1111156 [Mycena haematopus]|nr:hypothetical protein B0H12DRAFT_1111156 [Mycena haematopus]